MNSAVLAPKIVTAKKIEKICNEISILETGNSGLSKAIADMAALI